MKTNRKEILNELKDLNADFLFNEKERTSNQASDFELSEDFFQSVIKNAESSESPKVIPLSVKENKSSFRKIFSIAASFVALLAILGIIYSTAISNKHTVQNTNLDVLISQTSSDEILDYLAKYSTSDDDDTLSDYLNELL
ncbi:MAG: hypothetical protein M9887_11900 [Chitinophagales bacterium]|nr:hypothetical protein [Chitinophagales bacterium]